MVAGTKGEQKERSKGRKRKVPEEESRTTLQTACGITPKRRALPSTQPLKKWWCWQIAMPRTEQEVIEMLGKHRKRSVLYPEADNTLVQLTILKLADDLEVPVLDI